MRMPSSAPRLTTPTMVTEVTSAEVLHDLIGEGVDRVLDLVGIHDFALRAALVGLVAGLLGLLDAVENRERAFGDPVPDVVGEAFVIAIVAMGAGVADKLNRQLALAIVASQQQRRIGARRARGENAASDTRPRSA